MLIEMWTDFTCPFCYIGKKNLDDAIKNLGLEVEIEYHSFQTYAQCPKNSTDCIYDVALKNGMSLKQAQDKAKYIEDLARVSGLDFKMDNVIMTNTFDAHRLTLFAKEKGLDIEMTTKILNAVFIGGKSVGNFEVLATLASEIGLDYNEVISMLESDEMTSNVNDEISSAIKLGVSGVPYFVIDKKHRFSGTMPIENFEKILSQM